MITKTPTKRLYHQALSRFVSLFITLPLFFTVSYYFYDYYHELQEKAEVSVAWHARNTATNLQNQLTDIRYQVMEFSRSKAMGEVAVNILYSQFALKQMQAQVEASANLYATFIMDDSGFVIEGYPLETLKEQSDELLKITQQTMAQQSQDTTPRLMAIASEHLQSALPDAQNDYQLFYVVPLRKELSSIVEPFKITSALFVWLNMPAITTQAGVSDLSSADSHIRLFADDAVFLSPKNNDDVQQIRHELTLDYSVQMHLKMVPLRLAISHPRAHYFNHFNTSIAWSIVLFLGLMLLVILFLKRYVAYLQAPLKELSHISQRFAEGDYSPSNYDAQFIEFGQLIKAMNKQGKTIQQNIQTLERAITKAEQSEKLKSQFLANMSHEIRTPMNGVLGMLKLLQSQPLSEQQLDWAKKGTYSAKNLLAIINDILDLSKIEAGKVELENVEFNLHEVVSAIQSNLQATADEKGLLLNIHFADDVPMFWLGDSTRISQILYNLLSNAIKFTASGQVSVTFSRDHNKNGLNIEVKDSGIGIQPQHLEQLFTAFKQADASTTRRYGGTGLGLVITKHLIELMGGTIDVVSQLNQGTTFKVFLEIVHSDIQHKTIETENIQVPNLLNKRILVAEDNEINQAILQHVLDETNATILMVDDGIKACAAEPTFKPDIILMDVQMPHMDGVEATKTIRLHGYKGPIIMQTANVMTEDIELYLQQGADGHIAKPLDVTQLYHILAHHLLAR